MTKDPYRYFRIEARELLEQLSRGVLKLEHGDAPAEVVPGLLRHAHTLKGAARVVGRREVGERAHAIEDALVRLRDASTPPGQEVVDLLLSHVDAIERDLDALGPAAPPADAPEAPPEPVSPEPPSATSFTSARVAPAELESLLHDVSESRVLLEAARRAALGCERARVLAGQLRAGSTRGRDESIADELLGVLRTMERSLDGSFDRLERELRQVHAAAERLTLLPAAMLLAPLERTARDAGHVASRKVRFVFRGGDVRIEAHVLHAAQDALIQLVRNAVVHGIEPEEERRAAGKPSPGTITVAVERTGDRVTLACSDDGRGLDLRAVREVVRASGRFAGGREPTDDELVDLLVRGGYSTAAAVTEVSGRGVGLDVARTRVERVGGTLTLRSGQGRGMSAEIVVPISVAAMEVLLLRDGDASAAIPSSCVRRVLRLAATDVGRGADGRTIVHEGTVVPLVWLRRAVGADSAPSDAGPFTALLVDRGGRSPVALAVDRVVGVADAVVRPLPPLAPADPVVAGAALDEAGRPRIVIDPARLSAHEGRTGEVVDERPREVPPLLVIDDSMTTRMLEQSILESAGYEVDTATSGEEALELARRKRYGVFVIDVEMPGIDGFTFIERTRADPELRDVPALLVTSRGDPADRRRGEEVGAAAYVLKSEFDQRRLLEIIARLLART